jgi:hypothetical protein
MSTHIPFEQMTKAEQAAAIREWNEEVEWFADGVQAREIERGQGNVPAVPGMLADQARAVVAVASAYRKLRTGAEARPEAVVTATPIYVLNLRKGALLTMALEFDNGGNTFQGWVLNAPYDHPDVQSLGYVQRINSAGAITAEVIIRPGAVGGINQKADSLAIKGLEASLDCRMTVHALKEEPRDVGVQRYIWPGVYTPFPRGVNPSGGWGAFTGTPAPPEPDPAPQAEVDYALIQRMLDQSEADIITTTVGNQIPKTIAAMRWAFDLDARRLDLPAGERPGQRLPGQPVWLEDNQALMRRMIT